MRLSETWHGPSGSSQGDVTTPTWSTWASATGLPRPRQQRGERCPANLEGQGVEVEHSLIRTAQESRNKVTDDPCDCLQSLVHPDASARTGVRHSFHY